MGQELADRRFAEPLDLDTLAAEACVSRYHFVRAFAAAYGETPMRYVSRRRIERAQDLLRTANLTVTEVCMLVGFSSLGSFSARFSELVGESPRAYRNRWAATGGPHVPGCFLFMRGIDRSAPPDDPGPPDAAKCTAPVPEHPVPEHPVPEHPVPEQPVPAARESEQPRRSARPAESLSSAP